MVSPTWHRGCRSILTISRSFKEIESVSERIVYKGGINNPQGSMGNVHGRTVVFTATLRRMLDISVIDRWLKKRLPLDDRVIEAISKRLDSYIGARKKENRENPNIF